MVALLKKAVRPFIGPRPTSKGGMPLREQKRLIREAVNRTQPERLRRCLEGNHNPPHDQWYLDYGAVKIGGPCTRCGITFPSELVWIGNAWDFDSTYTEMNSGVITDHNLLAAAVDEHINYLHV